MAESVHVIEYKHESHERTETSNDDKSNLIINYLPVDIDDFMLKNLFAEHGNIQQTKVVRDKITKKSLGIQICKVPPPIYPHIHSIGFGFVKFSTKEEALDAIEKKNGFMIGSKRIKVSIARVSSDEIRHCKLYVTNIPRIFSEKDVLDLFSRVILVSCDCFLHSLL